MLKFSGRTVLLSLFLAMGPGCTPEVGSEAWCEKMDETPGLDPVAEARALYAQATGG